MKPFWRSFWASSLANLIIGVCILIFFILILSVFSSGLFDKKEFKVNKNAILHITLDEAISEKSYININPNSASFISKTLGLKEIKMALAAAVNDDNITGILLDVDIITAGMASVEEIRSSIINFKEKSGKFVLAYSELYSQKAYYLSSVADKMYLFPEGLVEFKGLGVELMFFKGAIDKLGLEMQIIRGSNNIFKSAVEPFMYDSMSIANREQTLTYLNDLWDHMLEGVKEARGISIDDLNIIADSLYIRKAEDATKFKFIDELLYKDELLDILFAKSETKENEDLNLVPFSKYCINVANNNLTNSLLNKKNIAVIYAVGEIKSGKGDNTILGSDEISEAIRQARKDKDIKAIVLRVNSPGGSALASDVIWREVKLAREEKPVIVSMGDVAASGGYYISCAADKIYAQVNTITGSIGVFGVIPNIGPMLKDKLGITFDRASTNLHSTLSMTKKLSDDEYKIIQQSVDEIYDDFITKVAEGRDGLKKEEVDKIGQGRVWSGEDALHLGLIDEIGGINDAISYAAELSKIETVSLDIYPKRETDKIIEILNQLELDNSKLNKSNNSLLETKFRGLMKTIEEINSLDCYQARLPYNITTVE